MKNKVVKYWPIQPANGNIQYWDGEQWVTLPNGLVEQYLMTHSTITGPTWEYLELSSSSSSSWIEPPIPSSSSSSGGSFPSSDCSDCAENCDGAASLTFTVTVGVACNATNSCNTRQAYMATVGSATASRTGSCRWGGAYQNRGFIDIYCVANVWRVEIVDNGGREIHFVNANAALNCSGDHPTGTIILLFSEDYTGPCDDGPCDEASMTVVIS